MKNKNKNSADARITKALIPMAIIVQKYGGSSLTDLGKIKVAAIIQNVQKSGYNVAVVVSAIGKTTDSLLASAKSLSLNRDNKILQSTLELLYGSNINPISITTSSFRISILIKQIHLNDCISILHERWIEKPIQIPTNI